MDADLVQLLVDTDSCARIRKPPAGPALRHSHTMSVPEGWREEGAALVREFELDSFQAAIAFVRRLADLAERENHHPDMDIRYRRVVVHWSTHSAGGVTDRDRELAARTSELA